MVRAGLAAQRDSGSLYDRFRDRIVFPILDRRARTIGFGGRSIGDDTPKYLNSPETAVFHKGPGALRPSAGARRGRAAGSGGRGLHGRSGPRAVRSEQRRGDARHRGHARASQAALPHLARRGVLLRRRRGGTTRGVACARDLASPAAGRTPGTLHVYSPKGRIPTRWCALAGRAHFEEHIGKAETLGTFLFEKLKEQVNLDTIDGRARLFEMARPLLERLPAGAFQRLVGRRLEELTGIAPAAEVSATARESSRARARSRGPALSRKASEGVISPVRKAITLLVQHPGLARVAESPGDLRGMDLPGAMLLAELIELLVESPHLSTGALIERYRDHEGGGQHLASLAAEPLDLEEGLSDLEEGLEREFQDCLRRIAQQNRKRAVGERVRALEAKGFGRLSEDERREYAQLTGSAKE